MSYDVKVAGIALPALGYAWQTRTGLAAPIQGWVVPREIADQVVAQYAGQEIELTLDSITVKRVIVLGSTVAQLDPIPAPDLRTLLFTDVRWYWTRGWLVRDANVRRKGADTHFLGAEVPIDAQEPIPSVRYAPWSLQSSNKPWEYKPFMDALLTYASRAVPPGKAPISYVVDGARFSQGPTRIVEETKLDDWIPTGLARAIAAFPGRSVFVDVDGIVHVSDASFGAEVDTVKALNADSPLAGSGHLAFVDTSAQLASKYVTLFTPEFETKLWADQNATGADSTRAADEPWMTPVFRIPDKLLTVTTQAPGSQPVTRKLAQNSYAPQRDVFVAWGTPTDGGLPVPVLTDDIVRARYLGPWLELNYVTRSVPDPDSVWSARIRETKASFRVLFQVNPIFWSKILSAATVRAAVVDQATGTRPQSPVFAGFALRPKIRWFAAKVTRTAHNTRGLGSYTGTTDDGISADAQPLGQNTQNQPAPCRVHLVDEAQGIFFFEWILPSDGLYAAIAPSQIEYPPDLDPNSYAGQLELATRWIDQKLVARFKLATIVSVIPAAPNSDKRLFKLEVTQQDALAYLGASISAPAPRGPDKVLRVSPQIVTARIAQGDDDTNTKILHALGCGSQPSTTSTSDDKPLSIDYLRPCNYDTELRPVALAMAAAELAGKLPHYEGQLSVPMTRVDPVGSIHSVTYRVTADRSETIVQASGESPAIDVFGLLPDSARKTLLHQVQDD